MSKKLIIFQNKELFKILNEINKNFEFKLEFCEEEKDLKNLDNKNSKDYLVISKKKIFNLSNQIIIDKFPNKK